MMSRGIGRSEKSRTVRLFCACSRNARARSRISSTGSSTKLDNGTSGFRVFTGAITVRSGRPMETREAPVSPKRDGTSLRGPNPPPLPNLQPFPRFRHVRPDGQAFTPTEGGNSPLWHDS